MALNIHVRAQTKLGCLPADAQAKTRPVKCLAHAEDSTPQQKQTRLDTRRTSLFAAALSLAAVGRPAQAEQQTSENTPRIGEVHHTEAEWKRLLSPANYKVLREGGTELPLSSPLYREKRRGTYRCGACQAPLFSSEAKFESHTGWPSFTEAVDNSVVELVDYSIPFYPRTEVRCKKCGGHIGHVFPDGPPPTGQRYCMNGAALEFQLFSEDRLTG